MLHFSFVTLLDMLQFSFVWTCPTLAIDFVLLDLSDVGYRLVLTIKLVVLFIMDVGYRLCFDY